MASYKSLNINHPILKRRICFRYNFIIRGKKNWREYIWCESPYRNQYHIIHLNTLIAVNITCVVENDKI